MRRLFEAVLVRRGKQTRGETSVLKPGSSAVLALVVARSPAREALAVIGIAGVAPGHQHSNQAASRRMTREVEMKSCRHNGSTWIICGGRWEWCWRCGAIREMRITGPNSCTPSTYFVRPVGTEGGNPYPPPKRREEIRPAEETA